MNAHVSGITLGVKDVDRSKRFYAAGLGWPIGQERDGWVAFGLNGGSSMLGILSADALAGDAGVAADAGGFHGFTLSYLVTSDDRVDAVLAEAERAGGTIVRPAQQAGWGGYFGYFADPDGNLWKVAVGTGQPSVAE